MNRSDEKFVNEAKALFDESVERLDAATLSTLNQGRHRALEALHVPATSWLRWAPVTAVAVAVLVAVMMTRPERESIDWMPASGADMEILLGGESIEMLEDLEFFAVIDQLESDDVG